jgi:PhnB protein
MTAQLNAYLNFRDNAREAMEFYRDVFGGTLTVSTFGENHASSDPSEDDLVMHSQLDGENGIVFMASDTPARMDYRPGSNFSMSLSGDDDPRLSVWYERLADGGTVTMPLEKAPWGDTFGMCVDKFGVNWLINISDGSGGGAS